MIEGNRAHAEARQGECVEGEKHADDTANNDDQELPAYKAPAPEPRDAGVKRDADIAVDRSLAGSSQEFERDCSRGLSLGRQVVPGVVSLYNREDQDAHEA